MTQHPNQDGRPNDVRESLDELQQEPPRHPLPIDPIPVTVDGPVRVQDVPARRATYQTVYIDGSRKDAVQLLPPDPRRKRAVLIATDQDPYIGATREDLAGVTTGSAAAAMQFPRSVPLELLHCDGVYCTTGDGSNTFVSVLAEYWAD